MRKEFLLALLAFTALASALLLGHAGFRPSPHSAEAALLSDVRKLLGSDADAEASFGGGVAVSGDSAIVGASTEDGGGARAGAAYVTGLGGGPFAPTPFGDVNCDGIVDPVDAAFILQFSAGLLGALPCAWVTDVSGDGSTNPLDAALILQFAAGIIPSLGVGPFTLRAEPVSQTVEEGSLTSIDIVAENVANLGAFQFTLSYDPSVTILQTLEEGSFLGSSGRAVVCLRSTVVDGEAEIVCTSLGSEPPGPEGSGVLATVTYYALTRGSSPQLLTDPILADIAAVPLLPIVTQDGVIDVTAPGT